MRSLAKIRLYSFTLPVAILPLMDFSFSQVPDYFKGLEFRAFLAEILTQVATGVLDAMVVAILQSVIGA